MTPPTSQPPEGGQFSPSDGLPLYAFEHPRAWSADLPVSGALMPGMPVGDRKFATFSGSRPLALEGGGTLDHIVCAYETWGTLNAAADNAVLVCHALTGDSHAAGKKKPGHPEAGWWSSVIGPGKAIDTNRFFVVCANVLGGCQGTTGPSSINPETSRPYGREFPVVTIRDMVRVQSQLTDLLGIEQWMTVVGGSMGGMQVLEWGLMFPDRVRSIIPLASTLAASPWQIAWSAIGRTVMALDPRFRGGEYYDAEPGDGPHIGLALARAVANVTYRADEIYDQRFGRQLVDPSQVYGLWDRFQVESYLDYHGEKLARRFDANSYLRLNRAMDLHDVGRSRGGVLAALKRLKAPAMTISISSDNLYVPRLQQEIFESILAVGGHCEYEVLESPEGHDGFLVEDGRVGDLMRDFLLRVEKGTI